MITYMDSEGNYPLHEGDIKLVIEGWTEGDSLPEGWRLIHETDPGTPPAIEDPARENFWYQTTPAFNADTDKWEQTWDYYEGPSAMPPDDGQWWDIDRENNEWVLAPVQPEDVDPGPEPE